MDWRLLAAVALFTLFVCCVFVSYNPTIAEDYSGNFTDGEVFAPTDGRFDFGDFSLNCTGAKYFTARTMSNGHAQLIDDTGNITINHFEPDRMIHTSRDRTVSFLNGELQKPSWSVDGVVVRQIDFPNGALYSAYYKNSTTNEIIYLSTPDEGRTAEMMNSLTFN